MGTKLSASAAEYMQHTNDASDVSTSIKHLLHQ